MNFEKKIYFLHPIVNSVQDVYKILKIDPNQLKFNLVWDSDNPEYLFVSERFYYDKNYRDNFFQPKFKDAVKIYFAGECIAPDLNLFDYAIVFDKGLSYQDRIGRIPTLLFFFGDINIENKFNESLVTLDEKEKFCNFIYSNPNSHPRRDELFYLISQYKKVDSLGQHLRNTENSFPREASDWRLASVEMKKKYKFSIASENAYYTGYTSEKIVTSFMAGSIPIYWGNPLVNLEFNEKAFINANNYETDQELLDVIKKIDNDDELWLKMANEPWRTKEQIESHYIECENYYNFFNNIFEQNLSASKRIGVGTAPNLYLQWIQGKEMKKGNKFFQILRRLKEL